jgi:ubiquitin-conjugating enzyme E2 variant
MNGRQQQVQQRAAGELARGYSAGIRRLEIASIAAFGVLSAMAVWRLWAHIPHNIWLVLLAVCTAFIGADFISGLVHWAGDTWCSPTTPVIGPALVRPFREHHVDQEAITRHDFVETNGNNCLVSLPGVAASLLVPLDRGWPGIFLAVFLVALVFWVLMTNQFHKWAHLRSPPPVIAWLQRLHLILPPAHHAVHHAAPFNKYYCITAGWLNWPLTAIRFFPALERIISGLTGAIPRQDDIGKAAALALEAEQNAGAQVGPALDEPRSPA